MRTISIADSETRLIRLHADHNGISGLEERRPNYTNQKPQFGCCGGQDAENTCPLVGCNEKSFGTRIGSGIALKRPKGRMGKHISRNIFTSRDTCRQGGGANFRRSFRLKPKIAGRKISLIFPVSQSNNILQLGPSRQDSNTGGIN